MKLFLTIALFCFSSYTSIADNYFKLTPFKEVKLNHFEGLFYNPACSKIINQKLSDEITRLLKFKKSPASKKWYYLDFTEGPSDDPTFIITDSNDPKLSSEIGATTLHIPGNGNLYFERTMNTMVPLEKGKITLQNGVFKELQQPFYYIGKKTTTLTPIALYSDLSFSKKVAGLAKGTKVTALLSKPYTGHVLVKTPYGLTGWVKNGSSPFEGRILKDIFGTGD